MRIKQFSNFWGDSEYEGYAEVEINLIHPIKLARVALKNFIENKKGAIVCVSSLAGYRGVLFAPLYWSTKHGVVGFIRSMTELEDLIGIRVVSVAPG